MPNGGGSGSGSGMLHSSNLFILNHYLFIIIDLLIRITLFFILGISGNSNLGGLPIQFFGQMGTGQLTFASEHMGNEISVIRLVVAIFLFLINWYYIFLVYKILDNNNNNNNNNNIMLFLNYQ